MLPVLEEVFREVVSTFELEAYCEELKEEAIVPASVEVLEFGPVESSMELSSELKRDDASSVGSRLDGDSEYGVGVSSTRELEAAVVELALVESFVKLELTEVSSEEGMVPVISELASVLTVLELKVELARTLELNVVATELAIREDNVLELSNVWLLMLVFTIAFEDSVPLESVGTELDGEDTLNVSEVDNSVIVEIRISVLTCLVDEESEVISTGVVSGVLMPMVELNSGQYVT